MHDPLAQPWWVNLLLVVPAIVFVQWRKNGIQLSWRTLGVLAFFAIAFGFVEAAVVVYLRAAVGLLPGYMGTFTDIRRAATGYEQTQSIQSFPGTLLIVEICREAATMVMLAAVAFLTAPKARQRWACFFWIFAIWDLVYYAGLWITVGWPQSLATKDVLFLIPVPWISEVWFPILVSSLTIIAIAAVNRRLVWLKQPIIENAELPAKKRLSAAQITE